MVSRSNRKKIDTPVRNIIIRLITWNCSNDRLWAQEEKTTHSKVGIWKNSDLEHEFLGNRCEILDSATVSMCCGHFSPRGILFKLLRTPRLHGVSVALQPRLLIPSFCPRLMPVFPLFYLFPNVISLFFRLLFINPRIESQTYPFNNTVLIIICNSFYWIIQMESTLLINYTTFWRYKILYLFFEDLNHSKLIIFQIVNRIAINFSSRV